MLFVFPLYPTQASRQFVALSSVMRHAGATYTVPRTVLRAGAIEVIMRARHIMIRLFHPCFLGSSTAWQPCRSRFLTSSFPAHDRFQTLSLPSQWLLGGNSSVAFQGLDNWGRNSSGSIRDGDFPIIRTWIVCKVFECKVTWNCGHMQEKSQLFYW